MSGSSSAVERQLPKLDVAGSIPVSRSIFSAAAVIAIFHWPRQKRIPRSQSRALWLARNDKVFLRNYGQHFGDRGVIAESLAHVRVQVAIAGSKDESSAELKRILAQLVLAMALRPCPLAGGSVVAAKEVEEIGDAQSGGAVGGAFFIDKQGKRDPGLFAKEAGVDPVAQADGDDAGSLAAEFGLLLAQLRDVLAAENSSIVPQKGHDRRHFRPDRSQRDWIVVDIGQGDTCQPCAEGAHADYCSRCSKKES
jgi:hypothetical protein